MNLQNEQFWLLTPTKIRSDQSTEHWNILENFKISLSPNFLVCSALCSVFCASQRKKRSHKDESGFPASLKDTGPAKALQWCRFLLLNQPFCWSWEGYCWCGFAHIIHCLLNLKILNYASNNNGWELYHFDNLDTLLMNLKISVLLTEFENPQLRKV